MHSHHPFLVPPQVVPPLDPGFRPPILANRAFQALAILSGNPVPIHLALEQADGSTFRFHTNVLPANHPSAPANVFFLERWLKFLLWSRGGFRISFAGPPALADALRTHYATQPAGRFDALMMGDRIYEHPFEIVHRSPEDLPPTTARTQPLGRHLDGCRIGFDLGGSDRKVAAVIDGNPVFSEEIEWDPIHQSDPKYHRDGIMDSLRHAAAHLPRVDAIGGSAAGVYVNNCAKVASLFRSVPPDAFARHIRNLFLDIRHAWNDIPLEVVNDGEVTALAGSMALNDNAVLGIALGTSTAGGYVTPDGNITTWLNELAFVPVDYQPNAPVDEWSSDAGCGAKYFSQQCVGRLASPAGIILPPDTSLPDTLKHVQALMLADDPRARQIYQTIGVYLGYSIAHFADFYDYRHLLVLGRVTSGPGGDILLHSARNVLQHQFPDLANRIALHTPAEKEKRHGQAIAAASLPQITPPSEL
jgi:predicted NBD/HSP70 family sugar kinase